MQLRIATYNIHGGIGTDGVRDYYRIGQYLKALQVDIALLQEVDARHVITSPELDPHSLCVDPEQTLVAAPAVVEEQGWYGNALLSRFPVIESTSIDVSQLGVEPRNIQSAQVDVHGKPLRLINTHKGLKTAERKLQIATLYEQLQSLTKHSETMVLGGDFNEWQFFTRAFNAIDQVLMPVRTKASFPSRWPLFRLDRLWITAGAGLADAYVARGPECRLYSDHCPVIADINYD